MTRPPLVLPRRPVQPKGPQGLELLAELAPRQRLTLALCRRRARARPARRRRRREEGVGREGAVGRPGERRQRDGLVRVDVFYEGLCVLGRRDEGSGEGRQSGCSEKLDAWPRARDAPFEM